MRPVGALGFLLSRNTQRLERAPKVPWFGTKPPTGKAAERRLRLFVADLPGHDGDRGDPAIGRCALSDPVHGNLLLSLG